MSVLVLLLALTAAAQRPSDVVRWSAEAPAAAVTPNGTAKIVVTARIEPGWKLYAIDQPKDGPKPLAFEGTTRQFAVVTKAIVAPKPKVQKDENFGTETRYYESEAVFTVPVSIDGSVTAGRQGMPLNVTFQACGGDVCLRPFTQKLQVNVDVKR